MILSWTMDIPDADYAALETFVAAQVQHKADPDTGAPLVVQTYPTVADYVSAYVVDRMAQLKSQYPSVEARTKMAQIAQAQQELQALNRPKPVQVVITPVTPVQVKP